MATLGLDGYQFIICSVSEKLRNIVMCAAGGPSVQINKYVFC
jgi:hypothetical protein